MELLIVYMAALYGSLLGSFFNVVGLRVPKNDSIVHTGSHCTACSRNLNWYELIPIFSWLCQKGKCRGCQTKISALYPVIELSTAFLFMISPLVVGLSKELLVSWCLISLLMIVTVSDIKYMMIPDGSVIFYARFHCLTYIYSPCSLVGSHSWICSWLRASVLHCCCIKRRDGWRRR